MIKSVTDSTLFLPARDSSLLTLEFGPQNRCRRLPGARAGPFLEPLAQCLTIACGYVILKEIWRKSAVFEVLMRRGDARTLWLCLLLSER